MSLRHPVVRRVYIYSDLYRDPYYIYRCNINIVIYITPTVIYIVFILHLSISQTPAMQPCMYIYNYLICIIRFSLSNLDHQCQFA